MSSIHHTRDVRLRSHRCVVRTLLLASGLSLALAGVAQATIVQVDYLDRNGVGGFPDNGGPHWTGFVDTVSHTLPINTRADLPGTPEFWTPLWTPDLSAFPLVWHAVNSSGAPYDVPDNWLGHIDATFGFISPVSAQQMQWNQGEWGQSPSFHLPPEVDFYPGWGGVRKPVSVNGVTQMVYDT